MKDRFRLFLIAASLTASCTTEASAATRIAVFGFELIDTSLDGEMRGQNPDEQRRLAALKPRVDAYLAANGDLQPVDITPVRKAAEAQNLQACGGCDRHLARDLGAALALTGTVQKVSNLILNINMIVRDVATGKVVAAGSADIRSNTDASWFKGVDWLLQHRIAQQLANRQP
jgi:uncharacterized ParB-like nuclease family protein